MRAILAAAVTILVILACFLGGQAQITVNPRTVTTNAAGGIVVVSVALSSTTYANRPATPTEGTLAALSDANTVTWGATVSAGGSTGHVLVYFDGTNWTVSGK